MLTDAAAVGADSLVHVVSDDSGIDSSNTQSLLASAVQRIGAEVVLCGKQAADTNAGSTGPGVASILGFTCVGMVSEVSAEGGGFVAMRTSPSGNEKVSVSKPCLFAFDKAATEMRRPNVRGIMMAKKKAVETLTPADLGVTIDSPRVTLESHSAPAEKPPGQKFEGAESVPTVVSKLRDEANVI